MNTIESLSELRSVVKAWKLSGLIVGFVPTMGNLHAGHLSLVELAKQRCDKVVVSVFVNPMQFGPDEDFDSYPRTFQADSEKLASLSVDVLYVPSVAEMYPNGLEQSVVSVPPALTGLLEGASRPSHFDGVSTIVCKLFNMVQADVSVFGKKDYQQLRVIQQMVQDLNIPIEVVAAPIVRDVDGLALSSRNQYLSKTERAIAPKLSVVLQDIALAIESGNQSFTVLTDVATQRLLDEGFDLVDYIQVCDSITLQAAESASQSLVILAVARLGNARLLDNREVEL
ncbi:MAG: pantoate--beta-alanine ligase [Thiomicrorhabdus sp.]|nr:pantoate--beta-alanine ligase [Thiomicrorhabdus sp.]